MIGLSVTGFGCHDFKNITSKKLYLYMEVILGNIFEQKSRFKNDKSEEGKWYSSIKKLFERE